MKKSILPLLLGHCSQSNLYYVEFLLVMMDDYDFLGQIGKKSGGETKISALNKDILIDVNYKFSDKFVISRLHFLIEYAED